MRTSFGDYRAKMAAEEKSAKLDAGRVKIVSVSGDSGIKENGSSSNKVTFIKKAASKVAAPSDSNSDSAATATSSGFKFSFKIPGGENS